MHSITYYVWIEDCSGSPRWAVERPVSWLGRIKGLIGRRSPESGDGLWLSPCNGVHTWFMRFDIDVITLDREQTVLDIRRHVGPWRLVWPVRHGRSVLELAAGGAGGLCPGTRLVFRRADGEPTQGG